MTGFVDAVRCSNFIISGFFDLLWSCLIT